MVCGVHEQDRAGYVTRKAINDALRARGRDESLYAGDGYFYFGGGEAVHWLSSSVMVKKLSDLTLEQWLHEFDTLLQRDKELRKQMHGSRQTKSQVKLRQGKSSRKAQKRGKR